MSSFFGVSPKIVSIAIQVDVGKWFECRSISCLSCVIVRVRVVFRKTVAGDWRFDHLSGSHLQSQVKSHQMMVVGVTCGLVLLWLLLSIWCCYTENQKSNKSSIMFLDLAPICVCRTCCAAYRSVTYWWFCFLFSWEFVQHCVNPTRET